MLAIRLVLNNDAMWTEDDFEYYERHREAFQDFKMPEDDIANSCMRADGQNTHFYEIYNDDERVGDLLLTRVIDNNEAPLKDMGWEIVIAIYDAYQQQGYGRGAIGQLFKMKCLNTLFAYVNFRNPIKGKIESMLQKLGFVFDEDVSGYWIKEL